MAFIHSRVSAADSHEYFRSPAAITGGELLEALNSRLSNSRCILQVGLFLLIDYKQAGAECGSDKAQIGPHFSAKGDFFFILQIATSHPERGRAVVFRLLPISPSCLTCFFVYILCVGASGSDHKG